MARRVRHLAAGAAVCAAGAAGVVLWCAPPPSAYEVKAAPGAGDRRCADVVSGVPDRVLGEPRARTGAAGAAVWGDASIVLRCGVRPPDPTTDLCVNVDGADGVDWVLDEARAREDGVKVLTTYCRTPAVEVTIGAEHGVPGDALVAVEGALARLPRAARCVGPGDTL